MKLPNIFLLKCLFLNSFAMKMAESGFTDYNIKKHFFVTTKCRVEATENTGVKATKLVDLMPAFAYSAVGILFSIIVFAIEILQRIAKRKIMFIAVSVRTSPITNVL